ncbi:hypothetical protein F53441_10397 [Fusarium austroafricanum]|uniref:Ribosome biogenesis protein SLX9 n=1 Tax=Fusarium austroafricanum TaxID=2364996 RepID=A0A8H4K9M8_9HYPO|nr:hypothetical protein F53441_10397 [Fusarium austroafricanum]
MAPLPPGLKKPSARTLRHQRITGQIHPLTPAKVFRDDAAVTDSFLSSKRDKRLIKHSSFVSRITSSRISKSSKRRRPSKKLATTLDSLADALPELEEGDAEQQGKIRHKSLKSKKGALKKKERVVKGEMERFGVSMARLTAQDGTKVPQDESMDKTDDKPAPAPTANRWAALRGYISSTMEQNPAFTEKK